MGKTIWIINQYATPYGEYVRQTKLAKFLTEKGHDVTIIAGSKIHNQSRNLIEDNKPFLKMEYLGAKFIVVKSKNYTSNGIKRIIATLDFQKRVMKIAKNLPVPDVVISDYAGLFGNKFLKFKTKFNAFFILDILDLWPETFVDLGYLKRKSFITKILYNMEHKAYKIADNIIFSFEAGADYIVEKKWDLASGGDVDISKVRYLNNGIDLDEILEQRKFCSIKDEDLDNNDTFKVVYLGSIRQANNPIAIPNGAEELQKQGVKNVKFLIYGDGDYRKKMEDYCKEKNLSNIVYKGRLPIKFAPYVLNKCDLNLFNFEDVPLIRFGISPNKLFMYFSSEKPILSTVSPKCDLVKNRKCGVVTGNSGIEIAEGIKTIMDMPKEDYQQCCTNCAQVAKEYDYKHLINVITDLIGE